MKPMRTFLMNDNYKKITSTSNLDVDFVESTGKAVLKLTVDGLNIAVELGEKEIDQLDAGLWSAWQELNRIETERLANLDE